MRSTGAAQSAAANSGWGERMSLINAMKPKSVVRSLGKKRASGILILLAFMLFFYGPLLYMFTLAFANTYNFPSILPTEFGFHWWEYQKSKPPSPK